MVATQLYAPYGAVRYTSGALPTDKGFTGQRADALTGLDYYNSRSYDPLAGQFTSADTTLAGGLNRYAYVGGNPETRTNRSDYTLMPLQTLARLRQAARGQELVVCYGQSASLEFPSEQE